MHGPGCPLEVDGIPQHDCDRDQIQAAGAITLRLEATIADFTKAVEKHRARERITGLALVQAA